MLWLKLQNIYVTYIYVLIYVTTHLFKRSCPSVGLSVRMPVSFLYYEFGRT